MANNVNNGITGVIDIPGALRSRGAADGNQVGGVVAYAGDIYDTTLGKNQSQINQEFSDSLSSSENANTSRPIKLYLTGNNSEYSVNINYAEGAYEEGLGPVFADTCVDEYLLDSDTLEQVAQITNITSSEGTITITTDNNLGQLEDALYVLQSIEGTGSIDSGSFVDKAENGVIYGNTILNAEGSEEAVLVGSIVSNDGSYSTIVGGANFNNGNDSTIIGNDNTNASEKNTIIGYGNSSSESRSSVLIGHNLSLTDGVGVRLGNYNVEISPNNYFAVSGRMNRVNQNILEQHTDGSLYIKGLGGFNGTNSTTTGIKSLQDVISDIESNSSSSSSSYTHPSTHPASMITYNSSETYSSGNVGYEIKQLTTQLASKYTKPSGGIPSSDLDSSVQAALGYASDYNSNKSTYVRGVYKGSTSLVNSYGVAEIPDDSALVKASDNGGYSIRNAGSDALGYLSLSLGYQTTTKGDRSVALGSKTMAYGNSSHVEGEGPGTTVKTTSDYTSGGSTIYLNGSVDKGVVLVYNNNYTVVSSCSENGQGVFAVTISPSFSTSILSNSTIRKYTGSVGFASHAEGLYTIADGTASHAEGSSTRAYGLYSHAEGDGTIANNESEHAQGKYNVSNANAISSIGIGTSITRKNAFEVMANGDIYVYGLGSYDGTSISNVSTLQNVITGINTRVTTLENSSSSSSPSSSYITYSEGEGYGIGDTTTASGENSFAEGESTTASGITSHAEGYSTTASGENSHAEGSATLAYHQNSHAEGGYTSAIGWNSHAEGDGHRMGPLELSTSSEYYYDSTDDVLYLFIDSLSSDSNYLNLPVGTVVAVATENTEILQYASDYSYISDKLYFVGPVDYECPVIAIKNIPPHVSVGGTVHSLAPIVDNENYTAGWGYKFTSTIYINFLTGTALGDSSHSGGYQTNAVGQKSNTAGIRTVATNDGESAFGRYNVSEDGTIFSIGCGEWDDQTLYNNSHNYSRDESLTGIKAGLNKYTTSKNALMVTDDGDVFIKGIGGYDGIDSTAQGVKSVQQVIAELTQQIATLTNNQ